MNNDPELKPCPFCGGEPEFDDSFRSRVGKYYRIECRVCCMKSPLFTKKKETINYWNTRMGGDK